MNKPELILIGAGGHAHSCIDVIEQQGYFQIAGLVDFFDRRYVQHFGYQVIGEDGDLPSLSRIYQYALITIGQLQSPDLRFRLYKQVVDLGFQLPTIVAPTAHVSRHTKLGAGTIVMHGAIINAGATVGNNCIVNSRALIEHDSSISDHCHISTGAILNGNVTVGTGSFIGSCAAIKEGVKIGNGCVVGMGLTVRYNLSDSARFIGID